MNGGGLYCPVEECEENSGGFCNILQDGPLGWASTAFFMPGQPNMMTPLAVPLGILRNDVTAVGQPNASHEGGMWRNCPRLKQKEQKR